MEGAARRIDRSLPQLVDASRRAIEARLERMRRGAVARLAAQSESRMPGLKTLRDFLRPRGRPQERELSFLQLPLLLGDGWRERLEEAAVSHVQDLESARAAHYVFLAGPLAPRSREASDG